jgi:putative flippase GtrA
VTIAAPDELLATKGPVPQTVAAVTSAVISVRPPQVVLPLRERILRFVRSLFVGAWASAFDFAVLLLCIRWLELNATLARVIALVLSGVVLFFGSRSYAFHAQSGSISRQARLFVASEVLGALLNLGAFQLLVSHLPVIPPEALSQLANFLVFLTFYYPMRAFVVFRVAPRPPPLT